MPNRILKESICRSDTIDQLSWFEEVLFYRLIVACDDYGRFDGRPAIIRGTCFPLKDITNKTIADALQKLTSVGLVREYYVQGRPYLHMVTWGDHQQVRAKKSKYPAEESNCENLISDDINCNQMITSDCNSPRLQSIRIRIQNNIARGSQSGLRTLLQLTRKQGQTCREWLWNT